MRTTEFTKAFKRDWKKLKRSPVGPKLDAMFSELAGYLADGVALADGYRDHPLVGEWAGFRDCHLKGDLVVIYCYPDKESVRFVRIGTHSEIFG